LKHQQLTAQGQPSKCIAARDRTNPRSVARTEISTEVIAPRAYPVVGRNFNGASRIGVFSRMEDQFVGAPSSRNTSETSGLNPIIGGKLPSAPGIVPA